MGDDRQAPLSIRELSYRVRERALFVNAELEVTRGESVAIMGPSGCGKSTLLSIVLGLVRPDKGRVELMGHDVVRSRGDRLATLRAEHLGMVFQFGELVPELTPLENVLLAAQLSGRAGPEARRRAEALLEEYRIPPAAITDDLSGGERQRVAVARALMNRPSLILADEPTGSLDRANKDQVADSLFALPEQHGCAIVVVTHDPAVARRAHRCLAIEAGTLVPLDAAEER
ncbi:ABC transporter ATP-binding protein [Glycomyces tarimensis]